MFTFTDIDSLLDFDEMTDLQKILWVLEEIGCTEGSRAPDEYGLQIDEEGACIDIYRNNFLQSLTNDIFYEKI